MPISISNVVAISWLVFLLSAAIYYLLTTLRRSDYSLWENCLYLPTFLMGRVVWRVQFENDPPPEISGGAVLVANHRSSVDPFFVQLAAGRRVHWMVAQEFCKHWVFGMVLRPLQVIPTNRNGVDSASTMCAIRLVRERRLVGMFPEGKINQTNVPLLPVRSGAALVATRAGVPLIPLFIQGSPYRGTVWSPLLMSARVRITFGKPIPTTRAVDPPDAQMREISQPDGSDALILRWGQQIMQLSGNPDCSVQLASARKRKRPT